ARAAGRRSSPRLWTTRSGRTSSGTSRWSTRCLELRKQPDRAGQRAASMPRHEGESVLMHALARATQAGDADLPAGDGRFFEELSQRPQERREGGLVLAAQLAGVAHAVSGALDEILQRGGAAVVEVGRARPDEEERRRLELAPWIIVEVGARRLLAERVGGAIGVLGVRHVAARAPRAVAREDLAAA